MDLNRGLDGQSHAPSAFAAGLEAFLVDNALKFTEEGTVGVSVRYLVETNAMRFQVRDTGIGISKDHLPIIFEKFRQVDSTNARPHEGIGLGLYIVKRLSELLGGRIDVESQPGRGSTFTFTLPCHIENAAGGAAY